MLHGKMFAVRSGDTVPSHDATYTDNTQYRTQCDASEKLPSKNSPPVPQSHFTESHGAKNQLVA
jgi:hypothetical protein